MFLNIIPSRLTIGTGHKVWCDRGMRDFTFIKNKNLLGLEIPNTIETDGNIFPFFHNIPHPRHPQQEEIREETNPNAPFPLDFS